MRVRAREGSRDRSACCSACSPCCLAIPPIEARSIVWPVARRAPRRSPAAIWAVDARRARLGWGAVVVGLVGIGLAGLAIQLELREPEQVFTRRLFAAMLVFATPLVFAGIGGLFSERTGVVNIGLEGMMLMGAFFGISAPTRRAAGSSGSLAAMVAGGLLALVHAFFSIHLRADQIVGGTAINFLALGITATSSSSSTTARTSRGIPTIPNVDAPVRSRTGGSSGPRSGNLNLMVWLSFLLVIVSYVVIFKTPIGLRIRASASTRAPPTPSASTSTRPLRLGRRSRASSPRSAAPTSRSASAAARSTRT